MSLLSTSRVAYRAVSLPPELVIACLHSSAPSLFQTTLQAQAKHTDSEFLFCLWYKENKRTCVRFAEGRGSWWKMPPCHEFYTACKGVERAAIPPAQLVG